MLYITVSVSSGTSLAHVPTTGFLKILVFVCKLEEDEWSEGSKAAREISKYPLILGDSVFLSLVGYLL